MTDGALPSIAPAISGLGPCPPADVLRRLLDDDLAGPEATAATRHVESCASCQRQMDSLIAVPETLNEIVRRGGRGWGLVNGSGLEAAQVSAASLPSDPGIKAAEAHGFGLRGYQVLGVLGRGGMGVVYRASQVGLGRDVAIKRISAVHPGEAAIARFEAEALAIARLRHPGVVQVFAVEHHEGMPYLVMEYLAGGSLADQLDGTPWEPRRAAQLVATLAAGIQEAHRVGVIHRDLKPANLLLDEQGEVKIADFGLAKLVDDEQRLTHTGDLLGSPAYMAPEQVTPGTSAGQAVDIHSLGVILYELTVGRPPYQGVTVLETLDLVRRGEPVAPSRLVPGIPADLETITLKCLERLSEARYASAADLGGDLNRFLRGESIQARPVNLVGRIWRRSRRYPMVAGLLAAVVLIAAIGMGATVWGWRRAAAEAARAITARRQISQINAGLDLDHALNLLNTGDTTSGLLRLTACLQSPDIGRDSLAVARANLAAWRATRPRLVRVAQNDQPIEQVGFGPDGMPIWTVVEPVATPRRFGSLAGSPERLTWPLLAEAGHGPTSFCLLPGGRMLAPSGPTLDSYQLLDETGRAITTTQPGQLPHPIAQAVQTDPTETAVALHLADGSICVLDLRDGHPLGPPILAPDATDLGLGPGGRTLLIANNGEGRLWDVAAHREIRAGLTLPPLSVKVLWSSTGRFVTISKHEERGKPLSWAAWDNDGRLVSRVAVEGEEVLRAPALRSDGRVLATLSRDGRVKLWDTATGALLAGRLSTQGGCYALAFSPDASLLATGGAAGLIQFWDAQTGAPKVGTLPHAGRLDLLQFAPDSRSLVAVTESQAIYLWEMPAPAILIGAPPGDQEQAHEVDAHFDAAGERGIVCHGNLGSAQIVGATDRGDPIPPIVAAWLPIRSAASNDGRRFATTVHGERVEDSELRLWDENSRPIGAALPHSNWINAMAFRPDGQLLAAAGFAGQVYLYDTATGQAMGHPLPTGRIVISLDYSQDGRTLAIGTGPSTPLGASPQVQLWDVQSGQQLRSADCLKYVTGLRFGPDGRSLLVRQSDASFSTRVSGHFQIWDLASLRPRGVPLAGAVHSESLQVVLGHTQALTPGRGGVWEWDVPTGQQTRLAIAYPGDIRTILAARQGGWIAVLGSNGTGRVFDATTYRPIGPPLASDRAIVGLADRHEGRSIVGLLAGGGMHQWPAPDLDGDPSVGEVDLSSMTLEVGASIDDRSRLSVPLQPHDWQRRAAARSDRGVSRSKDQLTLTRDLAWMTSAEGRPATALWHLDRLADRTNLQPDDLLAQVRAEAELGQLDAAAVGLDRVSKSLGPEAIAGWLLARAVEARALRRGALSLWYLKQSLAIKSDHPIALEILSRIAIEVGDPAIRDDALGRLVRVADSTAFLTDEVHRLAAAGHFDRASAILANLDQRLDDGFEAVHSYHRTLLSLRAGDLVSYQDAVKRAIGRYARYPLPTLFRIAEESTSRGR